MIRTLTISLRPTPSQAQALRETMEAYNAACNYVSGIAWEERQFNNYRLRARVYGEVRRRFALPAQLAQQAIAKVVNAYKTSKKTRAEFRLLGAVTYDARVMRVFGISTVAMTLVSSRQKIPLSTGPYHVERLKGAVLGEADLSFEPERNRFRLHLSVRLPDTPLSGITGFLGVDLGIVNLATDSDGNTYSGSHVNALRRRHRRLRAKLSRKFTGSARRLYRRRRRKERRFARHVNHCISKRIVAAAKGTGRGIALEDLTGIRDRITVRRAQKATFHSWSFHRLAQFIHYKAESAGIPVAFVDPRNTSRTCPACGYCDKANRPEQAEFSCQSCGCSGVADYFAAVIIGRRADVSQPDADAVGSLRRASGDQSRPQVGGHRKERALGHLIYRTAKAIWDKSISGKREPPENVWGGDLQGPDDMVKTKLSESQPPAVQTAAPGEPRLGPGYR
jgi:putative transposase